MAWRRVKAGEMSSKKKSLCALWRSNQREEPGDGGSPLRGPYTATLFR